MEVILSNLATLAKKSPTPWPWYYDFGWQAFAMALFGVVIVIVGIRAIAAAKDPTNKKRLLVVHGFCVAFAAAMGFFLHQFTELNQQSLVAEDPTLAAPAYAADVRCFIAKQDMVSSIVVATGTLLGVIAAARANLAEHVVPPNGP